MSDNQHSPGIEWVMFRLGSGVKPIHPELKMGRHAASERLSGMSGIALLRNPGDYVGKHRVDDARVGSVIVARFHNAPARPVTLSRMEVSA